VCGHAVHHALTQDDDDYNSPSAIIDSSTEFNASFVEAVERASTLIGIAGMWINPITQLKLNPARWLHWNEPIPSAIGQIDWIWNSIPPPSDHPNHPSAVACRDQLGSQLDEAARLGMVEPLPGGAATATFVDNILPLGAVVKAGNKVRMLVDPTLPGVNACMAHLPCDLTSVEEIFKHVTPTTVLGKRDLLHGFFHGVLSPAARRSMGFRHPVSGTIMRWVVLPQGTKQSPAFFCAMTEAAARIFNQLLKSAGVKCIIFPFVDDFTYLAASPADLDMAFELTDREAALLGLSWNPKKDVGRGQGLRVLDVLGLRIPNP